MDKFAEYVAESVWAQVIGVYLLIICVAVVIANLCMLPDRLNTFNHNQAERQEQKLIIITNSVQNLCNYDDVDKMDLCMQRTINSYKELMNVVK